MLVDDGHQKSFWDTNNCHSSCLNLKLNTAWPGHSLMYKHHSCLLKLVACCAYSLTPALPLNITWIASKCKRVNKRVKIAATEFQVRLFKVKEAKLDFHWKLCKASWTFTRNNATSDQEGWHSGWMVDDDSKPHQWMTWHWVDSLQITRSTYNVLGIWQ